MREYLLSPDVVRVTVVTSVILSVLFYERVQLTSGGAIVPGYLALGLVAPLHVVTTLLSALLTYFVVEKLLTRRRIVYGRRRFEVELLVGLAFVLAGTLAATLLQGWSPALVGLAGIGFLVPGLMAHDMARQGPWRTLAAAGATTAILGVFVYLFVRLTDAVPQPEDEPVHLASVLGYPRELIVIAAAVSVLVSMVAYARWGLRCGGFITGTYVALVAPRWQDLMFLVVVAALTYLVVVKLLMPRLLLFGRRKMSTMILVGSILSWAGEMLLVHVTDGAYLPWRGLTVITLMCPALVANDLERQGWERTAWGLLLAATGVFAAANLMAALAQYLGWI